MSDFTVHTLYTDRLFGRNQFTQSGFDFCRAMLCISAAYALSVCVCVCVSVTFVDHVKTNKDIFELFSPLGSHTILVFHTKLDGDIPTQTP